MDNIQLRPGQDTIVQQMLDSLESKDSFFVNTSATGSGKTIMVAYAAYLAGYELFVVAPAACCCVWKDIGKMLSIVSILSYDKLRGKKKGLLKHGYLSKQEIENPNKTKSIQYEVTDKLKQVTEGKKVLLVLDESHKTKNESLQNKAATALVQHFRQFGKVAFLTATPFDHIKHIVNMFRVLGIMKHRTLCTRGGTLTGILDIAEYCSTLDGPKTQECMRNVKNLRLAKEACLLLWAKVVAKKCVFSMSQREIFREFGEKKNIKNLYCTIDSKEFQEGMQQLQDAVAWKDNISQLDPLASLEREKKKTFRFCMINSALMLLESAKIPSLIRLIQRDLFSYPHSKIVVFCSFRKTLDRLCDFFQKWKPLRFDGLCSEKMAERAKKLFQDPSLEYRLFFGNIVKGELGIDLHDLHGDRPRRVYIIPTYRNPHQVIGRFYRVGLRSNPVIRFVYGKEVTEAHILDALARMKAVMTQTLPQQKKDKLLFPGEYSDAREPSISEELQNKLEIRIAFLFWKSSFEFLAAGWKGDALVFYFYDSFLKLHVYSSFSELMHAVEQFEGYYSDSLVRWKQRMKERTSAIETNIQLFFPFGVDHLICEYYDVDLEFYLAS